MSRPKGYANWEPREDTLALIDNVQNVLDEYRDHLPLTVRQIFYRLVGAYGFDKTEKAYSRLCEHLVRARRARMIPFDVIRDDGTISVAPQTYADPAAFWEGVRSDLKHYSRDRLQTQDVRIELWCEAAGMVPQLRRVAFPYSVPVFSTGGFSSVTVTHEIARRALDDERRTIFLHVGDYDPSGESIFEAMSRDAQTFVMQEGFWDLLESGHDQESAKQVVIEVEDGQANGSWLEPVRVALTEDQVDEYDLPTAPPKRTDTRSRRWVGETCQAEAMPPDQLAEIVRQAIRAQIDLERYDAEAEAEEADRAEIQEAIPD